MNKDTFEIILEECLTRLEAGIPLQEILLDHPDLKNKLEPLLQAAETARDLAGADYQSSMNVNRNRVLAEADRVKETGAFTKNGTKSIILRYSGQWFRNLKNLLVGKETIEMKLLPKLALYSVMTVLIAGFFTVNASASSLPGDTLYGVKLGWEQAQLALTFSSDSREELENEFDDKRLDEVQSLLISGRVEDVEFYGLIESKSEGTWVVNGISVSVDAQTEIKGLLEVGDLVKVEAMTQADGSLLALEIYKDLDGLDDDSDDDMDDDSDDDMEDDSDDDMDDDSDDDMDGDSDDDMDDDSDDDMDDDSDDDLDDDSSDDSSDDDDDEDDEDEEEEEDDESDD